jgi:hypothetical protein
MSAHPIMAQALRPFAPPQTKAQQISTPKGQLQTHRAAEISELERKALELQRARWDEQREDV